MVDDPSVDVVYVGAVSRSGSTLLDRLLGQIPGWLSGGELTYLWERGWRRNELCGCGTPFRDCKRWRAILDEFRSRTGEPNLDEVTDLVSSVTGHAYTLLYGMESLWTPGFRDRVNRARDYVGALYRSITNVTGCEVIVDSSKFPVYAYFLSGIDDVNMRMIHLVRDPRAVAHSWRRRKERPEIHWDDEAYMNRYNPVIIATVWNVLNVCLGRYRGSETPYTRVPYERLADHPGETLRKLLKGIDISDYSLPFLDGNRASLGTDHTASGNPMRMKTGELTIERDDDWREKFPVWERGLVSGITAPLRPRYGY